jgi:hypothetical protein
MRQEIAAVIEGNSILKGKRINLGAGIVRVLETHAASETPEQKLAFAVLNQAIRDVCVFAKGGPVGFRDALWAVVLLRKGGAEWAEACELDRDFVLDTMNTKVSDTDSTILDIAQARLQRELKHNSKLADMDND